MSKIDTLAANYINGNLTTAKEQAKRFSWEAIYKALRDEYGHSEATARAEADYLKGKGSFQAACDAGSNPSNSDWGLPYGKKRNNAGYSAKQQSKLS